LEESLSWGKWSMSDNNEDKCSEILSLIYDHVATTAGVDIGSLDESTDFLAAGLLDSFGVLNLILVLQTDLGISFDPVELIAPEARTVGGLAKLAAQHCKQQ
jgi:acyl carrier protein